MIQGILLYEICTFKPGESLFKLIRVVFSNDIYSETSYSDLLAENDIFSVVYHHLTGTTYSRQDDFSNTYQGRLRETKFQVISYYRHLPDGPDFLTILIFDLDDSIDSFIDTINSMSNKLESFFQTMLELNGLTKEGKSLDKRTAIGRNFKAEVGKFKEKNKKFLVSHENSELTKLFEKTISKIMNKDIKIFLSYSSKDTNYFQIPLISKKLLSYPEIIKVTYYEKEKYENIFKFMNDNIEKCDVLLFFCSKNSIESDHVSLEWQAALSKKKKVIPIFTEIDDLPALLAPINGIQFDQDNLPKSIEMIYSTLIKALGI